MTHTRPFDPALFGEAAIDAETAELNAQMVELLADQPDWWIIGAEAFRAARRRGEGPFPAPVMSSRARSARPTAVPIPAPSPGTTVCLSPQLLPARPGNKRCGR